MSWSTHLAVYKDTPEIGFAGTKDNAHPHAAIRSLIDVVADEGTRGEVKPKVSFEVGETVALRRWALP